MTDDRLRQLLHDRADDVEPADLADGAWAKAQRSRQRRAALAAGAAVAAVVVAAAVVGSPGERSDPAPPAGPASTGPTSTGPSSTGPSSTGPARVGAEAGGSYAGAAVWWAPPAAQEAGLPTLDGTALPSRIDLSAGAPGVAGVDRAVAVYEVDTDEGIDRVVVVGEDGASYSLDVSRLSEFVDAGGNRLSALSAESLSPDGRQVFFRQSGSLEVYDLRADRWTTVPTTDVGAERARWDGDRIDTSSGGTGGADPAPPLGWAGDEPYGPVVARGRSVARSSYLSGTVPRDGEALGGLEGVAVVADGARAVLVQPAQGGRWKSCCPVLGWLDADTVLLESRHQDARILAWRAGTGDLRRVSDIRGWVPGDEVFVGSHADPS